MGVYPSQGASGLSLPAGEQLDASLPLHVLPLYSLLAPEKQAQVTVLGGDRCVAWVPTVSLGC